MSCCQSCCEFFCPCLASSNKKRSSKWAYVQYKPITKSEAPPSKAPLSEVPDESEPLAIPHPQQGFEFPQKKSELPEHPQMFIGSTLSLGEDVVTQQPQVAEYNIGQRRFSSLPRTMSEESGQLVRGRAYSLPQTTLIRKPRRKGLGPAWERSHSLKTGMQSTKDFNRKVKPFEAETVELQPPSKTGTSLPNLRQKPKSLLKRRKTIDTDMVKGIPGLPVLEEESLTKDSTLPLIQFSLQYDVMKCSLTVHLHHACNLPAKDKCGTSDPFVVLYMMPNKEEVFESMVIMRSLDPVFDESFEFKKLTADDIRRQSLTLRVYDHDKFSKNDTIGGVVLPLEDADLFGVVMRMEIDESPALFSKDTLGDLLLALSYDMTLSSLKGVVLKATNLKKQDIIGLADPYVKIRLYYKDKLLKKWKSSVKRNTLVPIFNESFHFDILGKDIEHMVMEVVVMDYDRFSKDDLIGRVVFSSKSEGESELKHWQDMINGSPQVICQWHSIKLS